MKPRVRVATEADAEAMLAIYAPFVRDTPVTFDTEVPEVPEFRERIQETLTRFPWLACETGSGICGYAYASAYPGRAAFRWCVESSIYVAPDTQGQGVGTSLYEALFQVLLLQNYVRVYASITKPNPGSEALHGSVGFLRVGECHAAGYKLGQWHDFSLWEHVLQPPPENPEEPIAFPDLLQRPDLLEAATPYLELP